ncbi:hypothetical protein KSI01_06940 [Kurthia sibirica]|nr:hypothetical protein KSI01_06940 [Kurthia sibirica]
MNKDSNNKQLLIVSKLKLVCKLRYVNKLRDFTFSTEIVTIEEIEVKENGTKRTMSKTI